MNPYEVLGVNTSAAKGVIRKAYKILAHRHHPDKDGDVEKFQEIKLAYEVLYDEESRKRYDETGEFGIKPNKTQKALGELANIFMKIIQQNISRLECIDIVEVCTNAVNNNIDELNQGITNGQGFIIKLRIAKGKLKSKKNDILESMLDSEIEKINFQTAQAQNTIDVLDMIKDILSDYDYEIDTPAATTYSTVHGHGIPFNFETTA